MPRDRAAKAALYRCEICWLHRSLCLCELVPSLTTRTRLVLILHQLELRKPTNTGRLAARCLDNSVVLIRGRGAEPNPETAWTASQPVLLYPHAGSVPLENFRDSVSPVTLVVPDGTWRQARRARSRMPGLDQVPCAHLAMGEPSRYRLRQAPRTDRLATLEAIARALAVLGEDEAAQRLTWIFQVMVDRTLWSNGRIPTAAVTGGIPPGARAHEPLGRRPAKPVVPTDAPS